MSWRVTLTQGVHLADHAEACSRNGMRWPTATARWCRAPGLQPGRHELHGAPASAIPDADSGAGHLFTGTRTTVPSISTRADRDITALAATTGCRPGAPVRAHHAQGALRDARARRLGYLPPAAALGPACPAPRRRWRWRPRCPSSRGAVAHRDRARQGDVGGGDRLAASTRRNPWAARRTRPGVSGRAAACATSPM